MGYVLSLDAVTRVSKELKNNSKIVFTHGAYDLFHIGHLGFLRKSKQQGQILIVGVDSDELISKYKNVLRPVIKLTERLEIVSKLDFVDFVFPLQMHSKLIPKYTKDRHQYYINLYKHINPSVITYGRRYAGKKTIDIAKGKFKNITFRSVLDKYGGQQSTTKIIDKILTSQKVS